MPIYLFLDIGSLLVPFLFSFHARLRFDKEWRYVIPGMLISMVLYILWDIWFTRGGVWGFNAEHLIGLDIWHLPVEEWAFFICIPYACLFTHHCIGILKPSWRLSQQLSKRIAWLLIAMWAVLLGLYWGHDYTVLNFAWAIVLTALVLWKYPDVLPRYFITYLIISVPMLLVNGILTGSLLEEPVVWYNNAENMGLRVGTIPFEDFTYAFTMLLFPLTIARALKKA